MICGWKLFAASVASTPSWAVSTSLPLSFNIKAIEDAERAQSDIRSLAPLPEIAAADVEPGDSGAPDGPDGGSEGGRAVREGGLPLTGLLGAAREVGLAVAVEVADLHVDPSHAGAPGAPQSGV